jgi:hypothetical protein
MTEARQDGWACQNCQYHQQGKCRRHPPTVVPNHGTAWPTVVPDDWCGEFQWQWTAPPDTTPATGDRPPGPWKWKWNEATEQWERDY